LIAGEIKGLIDTGALLAILDRDDDWHERCVEAFARARLPVGTTTAVLTELFHLLGDAPRDHAAAFRLLRSGAFRIVTVADRDLPAIESLMARYRDRPMDFADATLVHAAERSSVSAILTVDHNDFETYRIGTRKRFAISPGR
jgi:predicted nucleic acid-binding protein